MGEASASVPTHLLGLICPPPPLCFSLHWPTQHLSALADAGLRLGLAGLSAGTRILCTATTYGMFLTVW